MSLLQMLFLIISLIPIQLQACDCGSSISNQTAYDQADVVFTGKVVGVETNWMSGGWKFSFQVEKSWKKKTNKLYIVNTAWERDCGYMFKKDQEYLVYVKRTFTPKTNLCMGNKPLFEAHQIIHELGEGQSPGMSDMLVPMSWLVSMLTLLGIAFVAFVVLRKKFKAKA